MIFVYVFHQQLSNHFYLKNHKLISTKYKKCRFKSEKRKSIKTKSSVIERKDIEKWRDTN